jgi:hypothetical protein
MGLTTMTNPNALGLTIIFSVTPRHVGWHGCQIQAA